MTALSNALLNCKVQRKGKGDEETGDGDICPWGRGKQGSGVKPQSPMKATHLPNISQLIGCAKY